MRSEDADLVAQLHRDFGQNPQGPGFGRGFLARLSARVSAQAAAVLIAPSGPDQTLIVGHYPQTTPLPSDEQLQRMRYLRVYSGDDFAHPRPFRALRVRMMGGGDAFLVVQKDGVDFGASTSALLTLLAENLGVAAQLAVLRRAEETQAAQMTDVLARLGLAWVLVEWQAGAAVVLDSAGAMVQSLVQAGRLRLPAPMQRRLADGMAKGQFDAILGQDAGLQILALPAPAPPRAVIYLQSPRPALRASPASLAEFTGLTLAEAKFVQQLANGLAIAQAGDALGLTLESARYYSKQAYAKLGLPSQSAVVQMINSSLLRLL